LPQHDAEMIAARRRGRQYRAMIAPD
jgi:hypothetical protein